MLSIFYVGVDITIRDMLRPPISISIISSINIINIMMILISISISISIIIVSIIISSINIIIIITMFIIHVTIIIIFCDLRQAILPDVDLGRREAPERLILYYNILYYSTLYYDEIIILTL